MYLTFPEQTDEKSKHAICGSSQFVQLLYKIYVAMATATYVNYK